MRLATAIVVFVLVAFLAVSVSLNFRYYSRVQDLLDESQDVETAESVYYLHVYSHRYRPNQDWEHDQHEAELPNWINTRIGTVSVSPGIPFYYNSPIDRNPELIIRGDIARDGKLIECNFSIWIDDPGTTFEYKHEGSVEIDQLVPYWDEYYFAISTHSNPYLLDYDIKK